MPYAPHVRVTALGRLAASGERFAYGMALADPTVTVFGGGGSPAVNLTANQAVWDDIAADIRSFHLRASTRIHPSAILEEVKFATIGSDGKYAADPVIVNVVDAVPPALFSGQHYVTPQSACVVSLTSARRGPTGKGRFYVPMPVISLDPNTLLIDDSDRDAMATSAQTLLNDVNNAPGIDVLNLQVVIASTKGYHSAVTGVRVGRVLDTVRSRRRALPESFDAPLAVS